MVIRCTVHADLWLGLILQILPVLYEEDCFFCYQPATKCCWPSYKHSKITNGTINTKGISDITSQVVSRVQTVDIINGQVLSMNASDRSGCRQGASGLHNVRLVPSVDLRHRRCRVPHRNGRGRRYIHQTTAIAVFVSIDHIITHVQLTQSWSDRPTTRYM